MKEKVESNPDTASTQDAKAVAESMLADKDNALEVDFDSDYEMAQQMTRSDIDTQSEETDTAATNSTSTNA
ncbi:hypothetical protein [Almyronema epifaneia]|uniref:Uncharacterized protein n=1 Tax=Almyronema epifaneia S1 TaxID=2991925 RepID=A0ABW6IKG8_9CYAN